MTFKLEFGEISYDSFLMQ